MLIRSQMNRIDHHFFLDLEHGFISCKMIFILKYSLADGCKGVEQQLTSETWMKPMKTVENSKKYSSKSSLATARSTDY